MQVGSVNNTFGVQGVREHCQFFKTIEDATRLRKRISECFERAALPNVSRMCCCVTCHTICLSHHRVQHTVLQLGIKLYVFMHDAALQLCKRIILSSHGVVAVQMFY
jgi:hypothetical protein